ncbi:XdhC family protein [Glycomyces sp. L485]|uniref:XdhC family protein n=1 Tax=Glycomyces sp. L485 TaxID=2909235 RepID=UPI001F4B7DDC|nr:XdhC/CoxI family protein [Glycomyces sp. L485]MCH7231973.1 XdhC family protein [Glycomyces sp. L485]
MRDIAAELVAWMDAGRPFALASVAGVRGSSPRPPGTALAVDAQGSAVGGVSGGCVEAAVYARCQEVLETGEAVVESFGYSEADAFAVGLTCGGEIDVLVVRVEPEDAPIRAVLEAVVAGEGATLVRAVEGPDIGKAIAMTEQGITGDLAVAEEFAPDTATPDPGAAAKARPDRAPAATEDAHTTCGTADRGAAGGSPEPGAPGPGSGFAADASSARDLGGLEPPRSSCRVGRLSFEVYAPPPRLLVYGAADFASSVVKAAKLCGFHVTVCDARPVFATPARFPDADAVVVDWPHRHFENASVDGRTSVCVLTHDAKFDIPLLERALESKAAYVGAMGSRRTHRDRVERLRSAGVAEASVARLRSPIGIDLGGRTSEETALSIVAEIVALRNGAQAGFLTSSDGPIHH